MGPYDALVMLTFCQRLMRKVCADMDTDQREFNGETGHVHLLVYHPPSLALPVLVNWLKDVSSCRLRQKCPAHVRKYLWGYWARTAKRCAGMWTGPARLGWTVMVMHAS